MPGPNDPNGTADAAIKAPEPPQSLAVGQPGQQVTDAEAAGADGESDGSGTLDDEK